jgi:predicted phage baseplate assembly protein
MLAPIGGVEEIFNPIPAGGGADGEGPEAVLERGPQTLRRRGRSLSAQDFETMAREASASVAFARALPCRSPAGVTLPGWVTLVIIPQGGEARPYPSFGLRQAVRRYIERQAAACLAAGAQIYVTGPDYRPVDVQATLAPRVFSEAGAVEQRARKALETFLHPLFGGPAGRGWEPGRDVRPSDLSAVLERVEGVDFVSELSLLIDGALQGESVKIGAEQTVVAGQIRLRLIQGEA